MTFAPVIYEHAARYTGKSPWEVSRSARLLAEGHIRAWEEFGHSPVTVGVDIYNLEAEAYGAVIPPQEGNEVPTITDPPFADPEDLIKLHAINMKKDGRWPLVMEAAREVKEALPGVDVRLPLGGPFSIATNLTGFENFLLFAAMEEQKASRVLQTLADHQILLAQDVAHEGFGLSFFESAATPPMLSPALFRRIELPVIRRILAELEELSGRKAAFILGGDTASIAADLGQAGAGFLICPSETDQEQFLRNLGEADVPVRINMDAEILASGEWDRIGAEVRRIKDLMRRYPRTLAGSGVLPYNADPVLIHRVADMFS